MNRNDPKLKSRVTVTEQFAEPVEELYDEYGHDEEETQGEAEESSQED